LFATVHPVPPRHLSCAPVRDAAAKTTWPSWCANTGMPGRPTSAPVVTLPPRRPCSPKPTRSA